MRPYHETYKYEENMVVFFDDIFGNWLLHMPTWFFWNYLTGRHKQWLIVDIINTHTGFIIKLPNIIENTSHDFVVYENETGLVLF